MSATASPPSNAEATGKKENMKRITEDITCASAILTCWKHVTDHVTVHPIHRPVRNPDLELLCKRQLWGLDSGLLIESLSPSTDYLQNEPDSLVTWLQNGSARKAEKPYYRNNNVDFRRLDFAVLFLPYPIRQILVRKQINSFIICSHSRVPACNKENSRSLPKNVPLGLGTELSLSSVSSPRGHFWEETYYSFYFRSRSS